MSRMIRSMSIVTIAVAVGSAGTQAQGVSPYRPGIDVLHYDLSLFLPDTGSVIRGIAVLDVRRTTPRSDSLTLDLRLTTDRVAVNGANAPFTRTDSTITFPLAGSDSLAKVTVWYVGRVQDGLIVRVDSAGRWTGFGDNWPNRARFWIPSVDHPSDKATVTWHVNAPAGRTVIANGTLVDSTAAAGGRRITTWKEERPIATYLMVIAAAPLSITPLGETACGLASVGRCVPQFVATAPEQKPTMPGEFAKAGEIVRYFSQTVGPFPYEKLAHLQSSTRFGGMENASAIFYADGLFRRRGVSDGLIAHETAHQWFGDAVTEREWPHVWLSEGFATYFAALWVEHSRGDSAFRASMADVRRSVVSDSGSVFRRPVIDTIETNLLALLNRNSYEKGGFVLHMLRDQVGDSAFFRGLRRYYQAHVHGNALSQDLQDALEATSGQQLGWFFDQWLRRPGFPELSLSWSRDAQGRLSIIVEQGTRFGAYRFPLDVVVVDASGATHRSRIEVPAQARSELVVQGQFLQPPRAVQFDPRVRLLATFRTPSQ